MPANQPFPIPEDSGPESHSKPEENSEPSGEHSSSEEERTPLKRFLIAYRKASGGSLVLSIAVHAVILIIATVLVVSQFAEERKISFGGGEAGPKSEAQHKVKMKAKSTTAPAPTKRITTTSSIATVALPDMPDIPNNMGPSIAGAVGAGGFGAAGGLGGGGGGGGGGGSGGGRGPGFSNIKFFGLNAGGKNIAFLVDYSQSMSGPFRKAMEKKLEESLKTLPPGTKMLIIPWAGGAWLVNQRAPEIQKKDIWQKGSNYDDFKLKPGRKLDPPVWTSITPASIGQLMSDVRAQEDWPGGTDWLSPIKYAMEADPLPDAIFIMTDGQVVSEDNVRKKLSQIAAVMARSQKKIPINALWIENNNPLYKPSMQELAKKFGGEFKTIDQNGKIK